MTMLFSNSPKKPNTAILVWHLGSFVVVVVVGFFCKILELKKFECVDFKYDNSFIQK